MNAVVVTFDDNMQQINEKEGKDILKKIKREHFCQKNLEIHQNNQCCHNVVSSEISFSGCPCYIEKPVLPSNPSQLKLQM